MGEAEDDSLNGTPLPVDFALATVMRVLLVLTGHAQYPDMRAGIG